MALQTTSFLTSMQKNPVKCRPGSPSIARLCAPGPRGPVKICFQSLANYFQGDPAESAPRQ